MAIKIDVGIGDTILVGRFKNKRMKIKNIGKDAHGMPTINGRKVATFRIAKDVKEDSVLRFKQFISETVKKVNGKWALCSKTSGKVLKYWDAKPSKEQVDKEERRVQYFKNKG